MRIIGNIDHPIFKVTIFSWSEKYIVKIEAGLFEQTYKFRESDFTDVDSLKQFFDEIMFNEINATFKKMSADAMEAAKRMQRRNGLA